MKKQRKYRLFTPGFSFYLPALLFLVQFKSEAQVPVRFNNLQEALRAPEKVEWLDLKDKGLKEFPEIIFKFKNLRFLDLSGNSLAVLPDEISTFTKLRYLDVSGTKISKVPESMRLLSALNTIHLADLPNLDFEQVFPVIRWRSAILSFKI